MMETFLDAEIHHTFWGDLEAAKHAARAEAANTGGALMDVDSVEIQPTRIAFIGAVPEAIGDLVASAARYTEIGSFHTTWGAVLQPSGILGYLVLRPPLLCAGTARSEKDSRRLAVHARRSLKSIPNVILGHPCCVGCRSPIPPERLRAVPNTRFCSYCQSSREEKSLNG